MAKANDQATTMSRRGVISAIAGSAVAIPMLPASAAAHPDAALFALEEQFMAAYRNTDAVAPRWGKAEKAMIEWRRSNPKPIRPTCANLEAEGLLIEVLRFIERGGDPSQFPARGRELAAEVRAALSDQVDALKLQESWATAEKTARANCRFDEIEAEWDAAMDVVNARIYEIFDHRAATLEGLKCKARIMSLDRSTTSDIADSIVDDLLAMQGLELFEED